MIATSELKDKSIQGIEWLARGSYIAKGILYGTISLFTFEFALGSRGADPNREEVLHHLMDNTLGQILLGLMVLALAGHTLWRIVEIWNDPYEKGWGPWGILYRMNYLLSGITYAGLGYTALRLLTGQGSGPDAKKLWVTRLLQIDGGDWLIITVGVIFLLWAGLQAYKGLSGKVYKSLELPQESNRYLCGFLRFCSLVGFLTVAATLCITGGYLIKGALEKDPDWVRSTDDLLKAMEHLPGGWGVQLAAAIGFLLMSLFMLAMARWFPLKAVD
jgi:hypothetical protein